MHAFIDQCIQSIIELKRILVVHESLRCRGMQKTYMLKVISLLLECTLITGTTLFLHSFYSIDCLMKKKLFFPLILNSRPHTICGKMHFFSVAIKKITFLENLSKFDYTLPSLKKVKYRNEG